MIQLSKNITTPKSKYLVFTSAGDYSNLQVWVNGYRDFDLWISYCGNQPGRYKDLSDYYMSKKGGKFPSLHYVYQHWKKIIEQYEAILVLDDDILINSSKINKLFKIREEYDLWILQPSFEHIGKISHKITKVNPFTLLRYTNFVEMNCPLFSTNKLFDFLNVFDPTLAGWGTDWWYLDILAKDRENKIAIIDIVTCVKPHDETKNGKREIDLLEDLPTQIKNWERIKEKYHIQSEEKGIKLYQSVKRPVFLQAYALFRIGMNKVCNKVINLRQRRRYEIASPIYATEHIMTNDGAWCWLQDPRVVFVKGKHTRTYAQWITHDGRLQIGAYDHGSGSTEIHTLKEHWDHNDHNVGSFLVLPDKRIMVFYTRHNKYGIFSQTSSKPENIKQWDDEITISNTERISYSHPVYLKKEKKFYLFWRGPSWKPTFSTSLDGKIWSKPKVLIQDKGKESKKIRPYLKVISDGKSSIHFAFTDGHPRDEKQNSIYYMRYEDGSFFKTNGSLIGKIDILPIIHRKSELVYNGNSKGRAWIWDIALDDKGLPIIAYTRLPTKTDHRYCYARWTGTEWLDTEITSAGKWFPQTPVWEQEAEPHYSGGIALDHSDPSILYLSRLVDKTFEIEQWNTPNMGKNWYSKPLTSGSKSLNVRPVVPRGYSGNSPHVLWMSGSYQHYTKYRTGIKLLIQQK